MRGDDLVLADDLADVPAATGIEWHPLDEAHLDAPFPAERGEVDELVVVDAAHHDGVDLHRVEAGFAGRGDAVEHPRQLVAPGHRREALTVERVEADVDPAQPGRPQRAGKLRSVAPFVVIATSIGPSSVDSAASLATSTGRL